MNIEPTYVTFEQAKRLKEKGFDLEVPHCFVHDKEEIYYFELFSFFVGTFCTTLSEVYTKEKEIRNFDLTKNPINNESEIYFDYNQDIRKLITRIYNGEEYMNDEKSFNMNINSYDWAKLSFDEEKKLKKELPNYNDGDFEFLVYQDIISAPEQHVVVEWLRVNHGIDFNISRLPSGAVKVSKEKGKNILKNYAIWLSKQDLNPKVINQTFYGDTPQEAYSAAFDYVLTNLI